MHQSPKRLINLVVLMIAACVCSACGEDSASSGPAVGALDGACRADATCDAPLLCDRSRNICVAQADGDLDTGEGPEGEISEPTCEGVTCSGHGTCDMQDNKPTCSCDPGFEADATDCRAIACRDCGVFKNIPAGEFEMGSDSVGPDEGPAHQVRVSAFQLQQYEVSVGQMLEFLNAFADHASCGLDGWGGEEPCVALADAEPDSPFNLADDGNYSADTALLEHPARFISYAGARSYCLWINADLPSEAQWEYAARGDDSALYPWGSEADYGDGRRANCRDSVCHDAYPTTAAVGSFPDGAAGQWIQDLCGNAAEWVLDWFDEYADLDAQDPAGPTSGRERILRGGGFDSRENEIRATFRRRIDPQDIPMDAGFRCAR